MKKEVSGKNGRKATEDKIKNALYKKALGYDSVETVEEYAEDEEGVRLTKKKITKKNVPPDITALKLLLGESEKPVEEMTDEELASEKERLLKILAEEKE